MSEVAPAAAPAAAPTNGATSHAQPASQAGPQNPQNQPAESKPEWTPDEEKQLLGLLKKSPFGKLKANGQEELLDSPDKLKAVLLDASRGRGAARLSAEAKKEMAEAQAAKSKAELLERALDGDPEALQKLGRVPRSEVEARQRELEALPPEVRQLLEAHEASQEENRKLRAQMEQKAKAEEAQRLETQANQVREQALGFAKELIEKLGTDTPPQEMLPTILAAWQELTAAGLRLGQEISSEQVLLRAQQLWEGETTNRFKRLAPKSFMGAALERLQSMPVEEVIDALPEAYRVKLAKAMALKAKAARDKQASVPQPQTDERRQAPVPHARSPLSPFRWK